MQAAVVVGRWAEAESDCSENSSSTGLNCNMSVNPTEPHSWIDLYRFTNLCVPTAGPVGTTQTPVPFELFQTLTPEGGGCRRTRCHVAWLIDEDRCREGRKYPGRAKKGQKLTCE
jgi:hypothetical protein